MKSILMKLINFAILLEKKNKKQKIEQISHLFKRTQPNLHLPSVYSRMVSRSWSEIQQIWLWFNTLRLRQNGHLFADNIFKCIFLNENVLILFTISLKFVCKVPINIIPALVQIMAWRRSGNSTLSEPMMVSLLMHVCIPWPQWVNWTVPQF